MKASHQTTRSVVGAEGVPRSRSAHLARSVTSRRRCAAVNVRRRPHSPKRSPRPNADRAAADIIGDIIAPVDRVE